MEYKKLNKKKGVAGIELAIGVVAGLFSLAMIVFGLLIAGGQLQSLDFVQGTPAWTVINDTINAFGEISGWFTVLIAITMVVALMLLLAVLIRVVRRTEGGA